MKLTWIIAAAAALLGIATPVRAQLPQSAVDAAITGNLPSCGTSCIEAAQLRSALDTMMAAIFQAQGGLGLSISGTPSTGWVLQSTGLTTAAWGALTCSSLSNSTAACSTPIGTSGATIPLLNGVNTVSGLWVFSTAPTVPTQSPNDNSTKAASTAYVDTASAGGVLANLPPGNTPCNPTGITAPAVACPPITAVAPLGISGSAINVNTAPSNGLFIGGAGNGTTTTTTSVGIGGSALIALTSGNGNFALGNSALVGITTGANNVGIGVNAGSGLTGAASSNVMIGSSIMGAASTGQFNVAIGASALTAYTGSNSTVIGTSAGLSQTSGNQNTYVGVNAGRGVTTGGNNSVFGNCGTSLPSGLTGSVMLCDGNSNVRYDWGFTTASTTTLAGPVVVTTSLKATTTLQSATVYSAAGTALPTCNGAAEGTRAAVSDATTPTFNANYVSGGAVHISVYCNGTNWTTP